MKHRFQALARVLLLIAAALSSACSDPESSGGEVMVVVTTDMAVPTDFDTLRWTVTPSGASEPVRQGTVTLESNLDFPATLAISAGPKTTGPVTIRFEGKKTSEGTRVRVSREATLEFPTEGTAALSIPLTWLCSDGSLEEPCPEGKTCQAGVCVDTGVTTSALPPYAPTVQHACTDVTSCFDVHVLVVPPATDPTTGDCIIEGRITAVGEDADVNIALTVDNDRVGNYGFCGPFNECHILLPHEDSPEGWQATTSPEGIPRIKLPTAICHSAAESVFQVQLLTPTATCPIFERNARLCPPPEDTCLEAEICPSSWPEAWKSYACTGAAVPAKLSEEILGCFAPPVELGEEPTPANGRWCCTTGEEPSSDPLLIDDMSGGPQVKLEPPPGHAAGVWWTGLGEGSGPLWPAPRPALYTYRTFPPITPTNGPEIKAAACLSSPGFLGYVAMQGLYFFEKIGTYGPVPKDVSEFTGISFWGWAPAPFPDAPLSIEVEFPNNDTRWGDEDSNCWSDVYGSKLCDNFQKDVALTDQWTQHFVRWDELHQSFDEWQPPQYRPPGDLFDQTSVDSIIFTVLGGRPDIRSQPFEFCVAHITFTR